MSYFTYWDSWFLSLLLYSHSLLPHVDHSYINVLTPVCTNTHVVPVHACAEWRQHYSSRNTKENMQPACAPASHVILESWGTWDRPAEGYRPSRQVQTRHTLHGSRSPGDRFFLALPRRHVQVRVNAEWPGHEPSSGLTEHAGREDQLWREEGRGEGV